MPLQTVKVSPQGQVRLPKEVLEALRVRRGRRLVVRVRGRVIELLPEEDVEQLLDEGLENLRRASLQGLARDWDNPEDEAWNDV